MGVLADTDQSNVDRRLQQAPGSLLADRFGVAGSIEEMKGFQWDFLDEAGFQVAAERCAMIRRDTDIFVQVEPFNAGPIDSRFGRQGIEDFELARSGRDDDSGLATFSDGAAKNHGGEFRRIGTHSGSVGLDDDIDDKTSWQEWVLETQSGCFSNENYCSTAGGWFFAYPIFDGSFSMFALEQQQRQLRIFRTGCMSGTRSQRVAFLGMGLMGARMSCNLIKAGYSVHVYNRTKAKTLDAVKAGAVAFDTPDQATQGVEVVISCVTDGPDVEQVFFGERGAVKGAAPGTLFIDMSTIAPSASLHIGDRLSSAGFRYLEAPVTGGTLGAHNGTLSILVGGCESDFNAARGIFEAMGKTITHCGPLGAGQGVKLCNQIMGAMNLLGVCEAMSLARGLQIDPKILVEALGAGAAASWALQNLGPKICAGDWSPGFMVDTQQKDMRLVAQSAENANVSLPGSALVTQLWRSAQVYGHGSEGIHALAKVLERLSNHTR